MIIAVDGPTASGKGTIAKALAHHFGLPHLDTGLLYRAVGYQVSLYGGDPDDPAEALGATNFPDELLGHPELRSEATGGLASRVSVHPAVRQALFERQRAFATQKGGAVLDGRDIGTVIAPDADVKLFITASVQERARRRWLEMTGREIEITLTEIEKDIVARDARDINRKDAPLKAAPDALVIDTTAFDRDQAFETVLEAVEAVAWPGLQLRISVDGTRPTHDKMRGVEGSWQTVTRTARAEGISHWLVLPCLVLTFLFGPAGFLAFTLLRWASSPRPLSP